MLLLATALALVFATMATPLAYASEAVSLDATKADVSTDDVTISADDENQTAVIDGCDFAVDHFERASKGSNRDIAGSYQGYAYYNGTKPNTLMYLVTNDMVLVYMDPDRAKLAGFDFASGELPSIFHVAISTLCGKHTTGSIDNHASHHLNVFS